MAYNPGITYRGGEYIAAGISRGVDSLSDAIARHQDETKNRAREYKALQEYADVMGYAPKDATTTMNLDNLRGLVRGEEAKQVVSERKQRQDLLAQQLLALKSNATRQEQQDQAMQMFGLLSQQSGPTPSGQPLGDPLASYQQAIAQHPQGADPSMYRSLLEYTARRQGDRSPNEIPVGNLGVPVGIPGMPGRHFVPTSVSGGQVIVTEPTRKGALTDRQRLTAERELRLEEDKLSALALPLLKKDSKLMSRSESEELRRINARLHEVRAKRDELNAEDDAGADKAPALDPDAELKDAEAAIAQGAPAAVVARRYKQRTGRDLL